MAPRCRRRIAKRGALLLYPNAFECPIGAGRSHCNAAGVNIRRNCMLADDRISVCIEAREGEQLHQKWIYYAMYNYDITSHI